jgi:hypothetical protein
VDFVIRVMSEQQMDEMVTAVKSPDVVASMLAPMASKGYGEATVMTETLQVVILLSPPPPVESPAGMSLPPPLVYQGYVDSAAVSLPNFASALLLAALVMMALL